MSRRERYHKKKNVLGIDIAVMRPERAVNLSIEMMRGRGIPVICFLSAVGSLLCQTDEGAADYVRSVDFVFPGDHHMEVASLHHPPKAGGEQAIGEFADSYLKKLFYRLDREHLAVYIIMAQEEHLLAMQQYMAESYPNIEMAGGVFDQESESDADRLVNEINALLPDVTFVCLSPELEIRFMERHLSMMNTGLCILIESLQPLIRKETEEVPEVVRSFHLERLYNWFKKEQKLRNTIAGSVFKKRVLSETEEKTAEAEGSDEEIVENQEQK